LLSKAVELTSGIFGDQSLIWFIFILNIVLALGFGASVYGLWGKHRWGRVLFLWLIVVWSISNLIALFVFNPPGQDLNISTVLINGFRFGVGVLISLWYFNLPHIKALFQSNTPN
jgi:hypothetical protein